MSITGELREYADTLSERAWYGATIPSPFNPHSGAPIGPTKETEELYAIADRIDADHEKAVQEEFVRVYTSDADMEHDGWIRLPRDADNEIVNAGDKLDGYNKTIEVMWLRLGRTGWWIIDEYGKSYACCDAFSHHHEPTVEDVLREFAGTLASAENNWGSDVNDAIAEYASKLQLKERK